MFFLFAGAADKGWGQKLEPAGAQKSISNHVSIPTRQEKKTEGKTVRYWIASLTFMYYTFRNEQVCFDQLGILNILVFVVGQKHLFTEVPKLC